ncbi:putative sporulation protein YtxC [Clostridium intestinale]|jgi:putative sporulation protein YtxC|uniref:putative sporulation protein YtxC n=1 Tax=Clostridium intestinale TaxID=36845 RepID=UPI002DD6406F|nr:putative sporulation protein YtxC [Clostridium intestinale]WRY53450.1 putative sporulation protein YtxC [Clostridium intestinale]
MLVLSLAYDGEMNFIQDIQEVRALFKEKNIKIGVSESLEGNTHFIKVFCDEENNDKIKSIVHLYMSNILYKLVVDTYKSKALFEYLTDTFFFLKHDEILEVEDRIMKTLKGEEMIRDENSIYCCNRINNVVEKIRACMEENNNININGFITFRMKEIAQDIESVIDKIVEKYLVEKEYKEFIKLLKYFVDIQESKIEEINLVIEGEGSYKIRDAYGNDIYYDFLKEIGDLKVGSKVNMEDVIISGLITNSPKRIIIHKQENCSNKEFIDTIVNVFGERVSYCDKCSVCVSSKIKI